MSGSRKLNRFELENPRGPPNLPVFGTVSVVRALLSLQLRTPDGHSGCQSTAFERR